VIINLPTERVIGGSRIFRGGDFGIITERNFLVQWRRQDLARGGLKTTSNNLSHTYSMKYSAISHRSHPSRSAPACLTGSRVTNISKSFTHKMAAKTSWHRYGTKLRDFHRMYRKAAARTFGSWDIDVEVETFFTLALEERPQPLNVVVPGTTKLTKKTMQNTSKPTQTQMILTGGVIQCIWPFITPPVKIICMYVLVWRSFAWCFSSISSYPGRPH